ncbi:MAG: NADH-quinone oxidoreductase subunit L [Geobacteraceae bacterium GWC2_55_20]|nr:MAG: NADH-quinone oxidoreductase subunit L [Geobacteraceae bacterium GWC2_55_20]OGU24677.1 MAG: NADH-quinone oxidoreductase subunit L [Geobacteraceae bacterium GWF2_54_21]HBA70917.1 NADH-quinone oxidoreductase subunit L [Geobacter sp.]HCE68484.1 NADH-quinone oxidoreductase subunit L [Geobacter sp.]
MFDNVWLIPLFPLIGFLINGFFGKKIKNEAVIGGIGTLMIFMSFIVSCGILMQMIGLPPEQRVFEKVLFPWIHCGNFKADMAFLVDPLSAVMIMVVTGVGSLIHLYSIGYMHGEEGFYRFFAYLNLFCMAMLLLVLGNNMLVMFIGWEGVGLCSYLLIGYYFHKKSAGDAGKKAFVMNRVGDFGFLLGMFTLYWWFGSNHNIWTINFTEIKAASHLLPYGGVVTVATLCFFVGATGKSAQIPLFTWLPDAMEGPTPVSALIHAATMVTAGVYMIGRMSFVFIKSPDTMMVVAVVGAATAIFAATIGTAQNDIKRVLAYSTVSQLGFMFLAMGVGAFWAGIFHLMTHAFFKACMFLGSGSVIHSMHHALHHGHLHDDAQDMRNMGGLRKVMPITFITFFVSTLAIAGIFPFSGFFSKDEILWKAFSNPYHGNLNIILWGTGAIAACFTAFYMFRLVFMTFFGECRINPKVKSHLHESPLVITIPLMVLGALATVGGFIGMPKVMGALPNYLEHWLDPVFELANEFGTKYAHEGGHHSHALEWGLMGLSIAIAVVGIMIALTMYVKNTGAPARFTATFPALHRAVYNKWYIDELYDFLFVNPCKAFGQFLWKGFDVVVVDGIVNGVANVVMGFSGIFRYMQSGYIYNYAFSMVLGVVVILGYYIFK